MDYDDDDPRREDYQRKLALGLYHTPDPATTARNRTSALAREIRRKLK